MDGDARENSADAPTASTCKTVEELKDEGNQAFKKAQLLKSTTAGRQYLSDAKAAYANALSKLGGEEADERALALACALHANLAAVYLQEAPPKWQLAKAAADIALSIEPKHVKALFRRAQANLEDGRQGLPEASLRAALDDLEAAHEAEPANTQISEEARRIRRRLVALEEARKVPKPREIAGRIAGHLLDRGGDLLEERGYLWGQTESLVHVLVPARGARLAQAPAIACEVRLQALSIALPASEAGPEFVLGGDGRLHKRVRPDDCSWQLEDDGLLLHIELAKSNQTPEGEHWLCVWEGHQQTMAPSAEERREIKEMARAACIAEEREREQPKPKHPAADETVRRLRELCPGVNIEWGDTSFDAFGDAVR